MTAERGTCKYCRNLIASGWSTCWPCAVQRGEADPPTNIQGWCSLCSRSGFCFNGERYCPGCEANVNPVTEEQITAALQELHVWVEG